MTALKENFDKLLNYNQTTLPTEDELKKRKIQQEIRRQEIENEHDELSNQLKLKIFCWVRWVVGSYLIFVAIVIMITLLDGGLLSDKVLMTLLGTTTFNVLGLPYLIIRALFRVKTKKKKTK